MNIQESAENVLKVIQETTGAIGAEDRKKIADAVIQAMHKAATACCLENDSIVAENLKNDPTLVARINHESEMRRKALISNLSAAW